MEEAVRLDLLFPRSGQRLEVVIPRRMAAACSGELRDLMAVCDARLRRDLTTDGAEDSDTAQ